MLQSPATQSSPQGEAESSDTVFLRSKNRHRYEYVVLHLLCQRIGIILKALLVLADFDKCEPKLEEYGHDIEKLVRAALSQFHLRQLRRPLTAELRFLDSFYKYTGGGPMDYDHAQTCFGLRERLPHQSTDALQHEFAHD